MCSACGRLLEVRRVFERVLRPSSGIQRAQLTCTQYLLQLEGLRAPPGGEGHKWQLGWWLSRITSENKNN